jgi:hypothetical protein
MAHYDHRFGYVSSSMEAPTPLGFYGLGEAAAENCQKYLNLVQIYTRLSQKKEKSRDTRTRAAQLAASNQASYEQCLAARVQAAADAAAAQAATTTTTVVPTTVVPTTTQTVVPTTVVPTTTQTVVPTTVVPTTVVPTTVVPTTTQTVVPTDLVDIPMQEEPALSGLFSTRNLLIVGGVLAVGAYLYFKNRKQ